MEGKEEKEEEKGEQEGRGGSLIAQPSLSSSSSVLCEIILFSAAIVQNPNQADDIMKRLGRGDRATLDWFANARIGDCRLMEPNRPGYGQGML